MYPVARRGSCAVYLTDQCVPVRCLELCCATRYTLEHERKGVSGHDRSIHQEACHPGGDEDYFDDAGGKEPRYYQVNAINAAVEAIAKGRQRLLLVMATGTGKTYTAFQIIWRLWKARRKKRILRRRVCYRRAGHIPHTLTITAPAASRRRNSFSFQLRSSRRSNMTKCPAAAPHRST